MTCLLRSGADQLIFKQCPDCVPIDLQFSAIDLKFHLFAMNGGKEVRYKGIGDSVRPVRRHPKTNAEYGSSDSIPPHPLRNQGGISNCDKALCFTQIGRAS